MESAEISKSFSGWILGYVTFALVTLDYVVGVVNRVYGS